MTCWPNLEACLPQRVNCGSWLTAYTLYELRERIESVQRIVLPICPLGTDPNSLAELGDLVLPPLFHEAMDGELKASLLHRIGECFPYFHSSRAAGQTSARLEIVEVTKPAPVPTVRPRVLAFSVDTAVEEHGPHLPLGTDTIQSYSVLTRLEQEVDGFVAGSPVEYGHLTWGLPFGLSVDITPSWTGCSRSRSTLLTCMVRSCIANRSWRDLSIAVPPAGHFAGCTNR